MLSKIENFKNRKVVTKLLIVLASVFFTFLIFETRWFSNLELSSINLRFSLRGERKNNDPIVIIGIDDPSIEELGNFPWDRSIYRKFIDKLGKNPKVIGFDIYFDIKSNPKSDQIFLKLLEEDKRIVIAAFYTIIDDPRYGSLKRLFLPLEIFSKNTKVGLVNPEYDSDGFIRRFSLKSKIFEKDWISFPLLIASEFMGMNPEKYLKVIGIEKGLDYKIFINYRGGPFNYPYFSFVDVLNGNIDPKSFKDKIVLIGATTEALHDTHLTPFYGYKRKGSNIKLGKMSGVEIHANSIGTLLNRDFIVSFNGIFETFLISIILNFISAFSLEKFRGFIKFFINLVLVFIYLSFSNILFINYNILTAYYPPVFSLTFCYLLSLLYDISIEEKEKRRLKNLFQRFISPQVVDNLLKSTNKSIIVSKRTQISVMFADIRNFTYYSDLQEPEEIVKILNEFFSSAIEVIFKYGGTVDKFMGDAIMAIFGAPVFYNDYAEKSVLCAIEIQNRIKVLQERWLSKGYPKFEIGIGIATGEALVGIIGPSQKVEYTAIGSTVNLASRLEGLAKEGEILICERTYEKIKNKFLIEDLGYVNIKGKEKPVHIYKVVGVSENG